MSKIIIRFDLIVQLDSDMLRVTCSYPSLGIESSAIGCSILSLPSLWRRIMVAYLGWAAIEVVVRCRSPSCRRVVKLQGCKMHLVVSRNKYRPSRC